MANPLFNLFNNNNPFVQFMNANKGKNPNEMIQNMLDNGQITQQQLEQAKAQAQAMSSNLNQFKSMFGFK